MVNSIIAMTKEEKEDFFPGCSFDELANNLSSIREISPVEYSAAEFSRLIEYSGADLLISGWKIPVLDNDIMKKSKLHYVCHVPGTVRPYIPRKLIEDGLWVTNWGNSISKTISECALMMILATLRRVNEWAFKMHEEKGWKNPAFYSQSLFGKRVGLHGFGAISQSLVPLLEVFDCEISTYSPSVADSFLESFNVMRCKTLDELFSTSDILVELAPYKPENYRIVTEGLLRLLPENACFVNVGRGAVVDEDALVKIAEEGRLQVALDVYETEPLPESSPFRGMRNVLLMPHQGGPTRDRRCDAGRFALENILRYIRKEPLEALVTLEVYDRAT